MGPWRISGLVWLLVALLAVTTPLGMGEGTHRDQLLDPLLPHPHVGHEHGAAARSADAQRAVVSWPHAALGQGTTAADAVATGPGLPPVPPSVLASLGPVRAQPLRLVDGTTPSGWTDRPPPRPPRAA